jgi:hypothetical protein
MQCVILHNNILTFMKICVSYESIIITVTMITLLRDFLPYGIMFV